MATDRMAWPPEAQAFSRDSMDLPPMPGTMATRPETRPCSLREMLQAAPTAATSTCAVVAPTWARVSRTALFMMSVTVSASSLPNFDWW